MAISIVGLASVEESWHVLFLLLWLLLGYNFDLVLACQNLLGEIANFWRVIFFVDHIEPSDELSQSLVLLFDTLSYVIEHFLNMCLSNNFEPSEN